jgi:hypothetical protein
MYMSDEFLSLDQFLAKPATDIRQFAPTSVSWAPGGSSRLAKIKSLDFMDEYPRWWIKKVIEEANVFFNLGVKNVFFPAITPGNLREEGMFKDLFLKFIGTLFTSPDAITAYQQNGIRVKFYGQKAIAPFVPSGDFVETTAQVEKQTAEFGERTLWWGFLVDEVGMQWDAIQAGMQAGAKSYDELITAYYGEKLDQVDMMIASGKFQAGYLIPPLLAQTAALYWTDFPGNMITETDVRRIFWDYAFARKTWSADKSKRYEQMNEEELNKRFERRIVWGVGDKIDNFWYHILN